MLVAWFPVLGLAQELVVGPFLQDASPTSVWVVWETSEGEESRVEFGASATTERVAIGTAHVGQGTSRVHDVQLTGLTPGAAYVYRVVTGDLVSDAHRFVAFDDPAAEAATRLIAMSDMQQARYYPDKYREVVQEGVIPWVTGAWDPDLARAVDLVIVPGDLVDDGREYDQWETDLFGPGAELMASVPYYPVLGNHEYDADAYFSYFHLPDTGTEGFEEHWWWTDVSNVRVVGLDSNVQYWSEDQRAWLDAVLTDACGDPYVDFVFAQLHHPAHSELWIPGEVPFTRLIVEQLEAFTEECGKPSVHFFGHTHGYSRGQSRDHAHLMVNVATAGGAIDHWGSSPQADYPEFTQSTADWGFVAVEVTAGADPAFTLTRVSRGDEVEPLDNVATDALTVRRYPTRPERPRGVWPVGEASADCFTLKSGPFRDADGGAFQAAHWQVATASDGFDAPLWESWKQSADWFQGVDRQAGDDLTDERVERLAEQTTLWWRVRYRDDGLAWSPWSEPLAFDVGAFTTTEELLRDPGAEEGGAWVGGVRAGYGACGLTDLPEGTRALAAGCGEGEPVQRVDLAPFADRIDAGRFVTVGGWARGDVTLRLVFFDAAGQEVGARDAWSGGPEWAFASDRARVPVGTRTVEVRVTGVGAVDGLTLRLGDADPVDCAIGEPPGPEPRACGGCGGPVGGPWFVLAWLVLVRRRSSLSSGGARPPAGGR